MSKEKEKKQIAENTTLFASVSISPALLMEGLPFLRNSFLDTVSLPHLLGYPSQPRLKKCLSLALTS